MMMMQDKLACSIFFLKHNNPFIEQNPFPFLVKKKKDAPPIFFLFYALVS